MNLNHVTATIVSASDLSTKEGYAVGVSGALTAATGATIYGIIKRPARGANEGTEIVVSGEVSAIAGGSFAAGDPVTGAADGKVVKATIGTHFPRGYAKTAAAADGATALIVLL